MGQTDGHLTATRFAQKPLHQPAYSFCNVPKAARDLKGSSLQRISNREHFTKSMAEMLLLCKEAMRRRRTKEGGSKPLSLEYLADRLDIDDPLFGYLVRTNENCGDHPNWQKGMLQGFITLTTFTNWQRTFRWDSANDAAFEFDTPTMREARLSGERKWDETNQLAREMQKSVHHGDIWDEGVVWPRIAEVSLLGGLGCGGAMVQVVIEELERMKSSGKANYDFVVLQATDNSIPFYESMGFVRVGAIMQDEVELNKQKPGEASSDSEDAVAEPVPEGSPEKPNAVALSGNYVSSDITTYSVNKAGTILSDLAKRLRVDVWDIIFLNRKKYPDMAPSSRLLAGTMLHVPQKFGSAPSPGASGRTTRTSEAETPQFYIAKENDTPRFIAKKYDVSCLELVEANKGRFPGLVSNSRLKEGTKIKVSHFDVPDEMYKPYAHWSFPDDQFEEGEPSYMMALKLDRKRGRANRDRPFLSSLAIPVSEYEPTELLVPPSPGPPTPVAAASVTHSSKRPKNLNVPGLPKPPRKPLGPYLLYAKEQRGMDRSDLLGQKLSDSSRILAEEWRDMPENEKEKYYHMADKAKNSYLKAKNVYERKMEEYLASNSQQVEEPEPEGLLRPVAPSEIKSELYNKVVRLKPGAFTEGSEYTYWYVLTYIPDLKWCHLAPLKKVGVFGSEKPRVEGRPKWMLVDESLGKEVDISSSFCIPIKARFMKRTLDADKEEWDIIDDGTNPNERRKSFSRSASKDDSDSDRAPAHNKSRPGNLIKPSVTRKRQQSTTMPPLIATYPGSTRQITVLLSGHRLYDASYDYPVIKARGRPKGSSQRSQSAPPLRGFDSQNSGSPITYSKNGKRLGRPPGSTDRKPRKRRPSSSPDKNNLGRPRRSAAPTSLKDFEASPSLSESDKVPYQPNKKARISSQSQSTSQSSAQGRPTSRSAGSKSEARSVESPKPAAKRWHPVRETRNGKDTPRARGRVGSTPASEPNNKSLRRPDRGSTPSRKSSRLIKETSTPSRMLENAGRARHKRKAEPTFSLLEETPRKRRALHP